MSATSIITKSLLRPSEVAEVLRVSLQTIYNYKKKGTLPCVKQLGRPIRFRREDIEALIEGK
jgi:excisionase family DNA binding protein